MKALWKWILALAVLALLLWPHAAFASGPTGDKIVAGGTFTLASGDTLTGNLYVAGGTATLDEGSRVTGSVFLMGGNLQVNGEIDGNIAATGGLVTLGDTAQVKGDVSTFAAQLNQSNKARVEGKIRSGEATPIQVTVPGGAQVPNLDVRFNPLWDALWFMLRTFLWAGLATLVVLFLPRQTERAAQTAAVQPVLAGGVGLLTTIALPLVLLIVAITLIGIPLALLGAAALGIAWVFGIIALGTEIGKRLAVALKQEWALAVCAAVGTFALVFVAGSLNRLIPCVGWVGWAAAGVVGLGAVLLTRFGTQGYPPYSPVAPYTSAGDAPAVPPAPPLPYVPPSAPYSPANPPGSEGSAQIYPKDPPA